MNRYHYITSAFSSGMKGFLNIQCMQVYNHHQHRHSIKPNMIGKILKIFVDLLYIILHTTLLYCMFILFIIGILIGFCSGLFLNYYATNLFIIISIFIFASAISAIFIRNFNFSIFCMKYIMTMGINRQKICQISTIYILCGTSIGLVIGLFFSGLFNVLRSQIYF